MSDNIELNLEQVRQLAMTAMRHRGFGESEAIATVEALIAAERDGLSSHGLSRLPFYLDQAVSGKVNSAAVPSVQVDGAIVRVDAHYGLAFAAVERGLEAGYKCVAQTGLSAVSIANSHHFGVAGAPVEAAARRGYVALAFSNTPSAIAPWGGHRALFGTNPIAFACPRQDANPLLIDLSLSKVARGKIMMAKMKGERLPVGWALDKEGRSTTDPDKAMAGSMVPAGDVKGSALALMVELLTAGLSGSNFGFQASSFFDAEGKPPGIAQLILLLDPQRFTEGFVAHAESLFKAMLEQPGVRIPGERRFQLRGKEPTNLTLSNATLTALKQHASGGLKPNTME